MPASRAHAAVADLVAAQAGRTPGRIAIEWSGGDPWTYARLQHTIDAVAARLLERGTARGEPIGVFLPRRPELIAAALGVLRAGAAYLPLDPAFPPQRLRYMSAQTGIRRALVWDGTQSSTLLGSSVDLVALNASADDGVSGTTFPVSNRNDLACVLYTSGSTGRPKGVRLLQRNLSNFLVSMLHAQCLDVDDVVGAFSTLCFDASIKELFLPLMLGSRIVLANETEQIDHLAAAALVHDHHITVLATTPSALELKLRSNGLHALQGMKLWVGGEVMTRDLADKLLTVCSELWNGYGPTEATVAATRQRVEPTMDPVPIGTPIANATIHVLDDARQPLAEGKIGEIWIGGAGVADGYCNDAEATAARFVPDPFAADGSRMYRTGDLGSLRDGVLYFHGRIDDQVKLHGYRIEPIEIEAAALTDPHVHQAAAVVQEQASGDKHLVLFVVAENPPSDLVPRLRATLRTTLPLYMWPRRIEVVAVLPRTPTGKIDRKALATLQAASHHDATGAPTQSVPGMPRLGHAVEQTWSPLVPIQPHGTRPPVFFIHALDGDVLQYVPLARGLGADQPAYGLRAFGLDGIAVPVGSLPMMATCYVAEIRRVQAHGPYFLAGHEMGGVIAYEVASQLQQQGERVGLLALIDAFDTACFRSAPRAHRAALRACLRHAFDAWRVRRSRASGRALPHALRHREIERSHCAALLAYDPQPYDGTVSVFRTSRDAAAAPPQLKSPGWTNGVQGDIETIDVPGNHGSLIEQPELLQQLRAVLQDAQRDTKSVST